MTVNTMAFPVKYGIGGMNRLAIFLNDSHLEGGWHFAPGSRFDQTTVQIDFDNPAELAPTWARYRDNPPLS